MKRRWIIVGLCLLPIVLCSGWLGLMIASNGKLRLATIRVDSTCTIDITRDLFADQMRGVYYEVRVDGRPLRRYSLLGVTQPSAGGFTFDVLRGDGGDLIGVVERSSPDVVLMMYRRSTGEVWSASDGSDPGAALAGLQSSHPHLLLVMRQNVKGRSLKVQ